MEVSIIVEKASDGGYSCYMTDEFPRFGLAGYGDSVAEAKADLLEAYRDMRELEAEEGRELPSLEFVYKYDMQSFFNYFSFLNITKLADRAGINPTLLRQYACGAATAGERQYEKFRDAVAQIGKELSSAAF